MSLFEDLYIYIYIYTYTCIYAVTDLLSMYIHILPIPLHLNFFVILGELWKTQLWVVGTVAKGAFAKMWSNPWWKHRHKLVIVVIVVTALIVVIVVIVVIVIAFFVLFSWLSFVWRDHVSRHHSLMALLWTCDMRYMYMYIYIIHAYCFFFHVGASIN